MKPIWYVPAALNTGIKPGLAGLAADTLATFKIYLIYILSLAACLIVIQLLFHMPKDIFRKLLHIAAFTSSIFVVLTGRRCAGPLDPDDSFVK